MQRSTPISDYGIIGASSGAGMLVAHYSWEAEAEDGWWGPGPWPFFSVMTGASRKSWSASLDFPSGTVDVPWMFVFGEPVPWEGHWRRQSILRRGEG